MSGYIQRMFSHAASLPWVLFIWAASDVLGRIEFIAKKADFIRGEIVTPVGSLIFLSLSVVWLTGVALWPEVKKRVSLRWLKGKTVDERIDELKILLDDQSTLLSSLRESDSVIRDCIDKTSQATYEHKDFTRTLGDALEKAVDESSNRFASSETRVAKIESNFNLVSAFVKSCIAIRELRNNNFRLYQVFESSSAEQRLQWQELQDHLDGVLRASNDYEFSLKNSGVKLQVYVTALKSHGKYPVPNDEEVRSAFQELHSRLEYVYIDQAANVFDWRELKAINP